MENKRYKKEQDIHLTKEEYLAQLKKYLKRLPKEDYNNAMDYFTEYFEDAGRNLIPKERGGLAGDSKWIMEDSLRVWLRQLLA